MKVLKILAIVCCFIMTQTSYGICEAMRESDLKKVEEFSNDGFKVNEAPYSGETALMYVLYKDHFIHWVKAGAPQKSLNKNNASYFALISFAMPQFTYEFEIAFNFLVKNNLDYSKLFTDGAIQNALLTQNIKAFEILIKQAKKDGNDALINEISVQVRDFNRTKFNTQFLDNLSALLSGTKITGMKKAENVHFGFK